MCCEQRERRVGLLLVDLREREADVDQHPVAGLRRRRRSSSRRPTLTLRRTPAISTGRAGWPRRRSRSPALESPSTSRCPSRSPSPDATVLPAARSDADGPRNVSYGRAAVISVTRSSQRPAGERLSPSASGWYGGAARRREETSRCRGTPGVLQLDARSQWPAARRAPADGEFPATHCYLLDADDDLAEAFDLRMRLAARQVVTARGARGAGRRVRPRPVVRRGRARPRPAGPGRRDRGRRPRRRPHRDRAGRRRRPAAAARATRRTTCSSTSPAGARSATARLAVLDAGFAERVAPVAADRARAAAAGRAARGRPRRAARDRLASRALEVRLVLVLWHFARALGPRRAERHPPLPAAHPPAARAARRRRAAVGLARAGAARARRAGDGQRRRPAPARQPRGPPVAR